MILPVIGQERRSHPPTNYSQSVVNVAFAFSHPIGVSFFGASQNLKTDAWELAHAFSRDFFVPDQLLVES